MARQRRGATVPAGVGDDAVILLAAVEASMGSPRKPSASSRRRTGMSESDPSMQSINPQEAPSIRGSQVSLKEARADWEPYVTPGSVNARRLGEKNEENDEEEQGDESEPESDDEQQDRPRKIQLQFERRHGRLNLREAGPDYTQEERNFFVEVHTEWAAAHNGKVLPLQMLKSRYDKQFPEKSRTAGGLSNYISQSMRGLRSRR